MKNFEILKEILMATDVETSIKENEKLLFSIIPILKYEKEFDQKNEWHCYDVWNHTIKTIASSKPDFEIRLVLLLHDIGKPFMYQEDGHIRHFKNHAKKSEEMARPILEKFGYKNELLNELLFLIGEHATTIHIENIDENNIELYNKLLYIQICDANGYEPIHAQKIIQNLENMREELQNKLDANYTFNLKKYKE